MKKHRARQQPPVWEPLSNATFPGGDPNEGDPNYVGTFKNNQYQVLMREYPYDDTEKYQWLIIRRLDSEAIHDWRHFQQIKNELCGPEREAIEIYPAESRLVDASNQYHLFVMPKGFTFPFGYMDRDVSDQMLAQSGKLKQRPFEIRPTDLNARPRTDLSTRIYGGHLPKPPQPAEVPDEPPAEPAADQRITADRASEAVSRGNFDHCTHERYVLRRFIAQHDDGEPLG